MFDPSKYFKSIPIAEQIAIDEGRLANCMDAYDAATDDGMKALLLDRAVYISIDLDINRKWAEIEQELFKKREGSKNA